ncbi:MAG: hypothetical protein AB1529_08150 [Candidatus Micrarchaeota archaeon]
MMASRIKLHKSEGLTGRHDLVRYLAGAILEINADHPVRVGIDGADASGKTHLANDLAVELGKRGRQIIRASIDGFHNPRGIRYRKGRDSPEGYYLDSFDNQAIIDNLLAPLGPNGNRLIRTVIFDFRTDSEVDAVAIRATNNSILVMEGVFLFRPELASQWDLKVFLDVDFSTSLSRALKRDIYYLGSEEGIRQMYEKRYIPGQKLYFAACNPKEQADILVDNNDFDNPKITRCSV